MRKYVQFLKRIVAATLSVAMIVSLFQTDVLRTFADESATTPVLDFVSKDNETAEIISAVGQTAAIKATSVNIYKDVYYGAPGMSITVAEGTVIDLVQALEFPSGAVLYYYEYLDKENTANAELYEYSFDYKYISADDIIVFSGDAESEATPIPPPETTASPTPTPEPTATPTPTPAASASPEISLDFLPVNVIAETESLTDSTAVINVSSVTLYKSLDNGAEGIEVAVEDGTMIDLVTKYTFTTDSGSLVFYRYDYKGNNTELANAAISETSGYVFIYSDSITIVDDDTLVETEKTDASTGVMISAELPDNVTLTVTSKTVAQSGVDTTTYQINGSSLFYDVTLWQNSAEYQPTNGITITFPESAVTGSGLAVGDYYKVYHVHEGVTDVTGPYLYSGGAINTKFDSLSTVGIAESGSGILVTEVYGELQSTDNTFTTTYAVIKTDSITVYGAANSETTDYYKLTGVQGEKIELFYPKVTYEKGILYHMSYLGDDTTMKLVNNYFIPEEYVTFTCCYDCTGESGCTCGCENCTFGDIEVNYTEITDSEYLDEVAKFNSGYTLYTEIVSDDYKNPTDFTLEYFSIEKVFVNDTDTTDVWCYVDSFEWPEDYVAYHYVRLSDLDIVEREDGTDYLESIYWYLMERTSKDSFFEYVKLCTADLISYAFSDEQRANLEIHESLLPYLKDIVYTPWSGRVGTLLPPVYVPIVSTFSRNLLAANNTSTDSGVATIDDSIVDNTALKTSKTVTDNDNGTYTINIEAYAEGTVTVTTTKTAVDVVLVLDMSSSMTENFSGGLTREQAVEDATQAFVNAVISDGTTNNVDHRVAVVTYNTNVSVKCGLTNVLTDADTLTAAVSDNSLATSNGTRSDLGLATAIDVFNGNGVTNDDYTSETRQRVVVFFTDGYPSTSGSSYFDGEYAEDAINYANTLKSTESGGCGATVYSVAVLGDADPDGEVSWSGTTGNNTAIKLVNGYLHAISSNYPDATATYTESSSSYEVRKPPEGGGGGESSSGTLTISNTSTGAKKDYYLTASTPEDLNNIFNTVSNTVISGSTSVSLGTSTVVKDIVTPYFVIPDGVSGVAVQTADCTGYSNDIPQWGDASDLDGSVVSISGNTIAVSGFDFTANYVASTGRYENSSATEANFYGRKLIIRFDIKPDVDFLGGNGVPTNESTSGIYDKDGVLYENLVPVPDHVDVPLKDLADAVEEKHIYYSNPTNVNKVLDFDVQITNTEGQTILQDVVIDGYNNDYVDLVYTVKEGDTEIGVYTIPAGATSGTWTKVADGKDMTKIVLGEDSEYTITCVMTPSQSGKITGDSEGVKTVKYYVYTPVLTFKDATKISYVEYVNYGVDNYVSKVWKHGDTEAASQMEGTEPTLNLSYTPDENCVKEGLVTSYKDFHVKVDVKIGDADVPLKVIHSDCNPANCGFDANKGEFMIHIKLGDLKITKKAGESTTFTEGETFIFKVTGPDGSIMQVVIGQLDNNDNKEDIWTEKSIIIKDVPYGTYTVEEDTAWSYRYTVDDDASKKVVLDSSSEEVAFTNDKVTDKWLSSDVYAENIFADDTGAGSNAKNNAEIN